MVVVKTREYRRNGKSKNLYCNIIRSNTNVAQQDDERNEKTK